MSKVTITHITSGYLPVVAIDANFDAISTALDNTLSRDGTSPNFMTADLDMNGHAILNVLASSGDSNFAWKGNWTTTTAYLINNLVYVPVGTGSSYDGYGLIARANHTSGTLNTDFSAGKWAIFSARGASGSGAGDLVSTNNLSDLANAATARTNLGGTTIGKSIFIAATSQAVRTASGISFLNSNRSSNTILGLADIGTSITVFGTFTQTITAPGTLGNGWFVDYRNDSDGIITLAPVSGLINGHSSTNLYYGESCRIICDGTGFRTFGRATGEVLITTTTASAAASVDFAFGLAYLDFTDFLVRFSDVTPATDGSNLIGRLSQNGAFLSGASDYIYSTNFSSAISTNTIIGSSGDSKFYFGNITNQSSYVASGEFKLYNASSSKYKNVTGHMSFLTQTPSFNYLIMGGTLVAAVDRVDGIQFKQSSGNITGRFSLYGIRSVI